MGNDYGVICFDRYYSGTAVDATTVFRLGVAARSMTVMPNCVMLMPDDVGMPLGSGLRLGTGLSGLYA